MLQLMLREMIQVVLSWIVEFFTNNYLFYQPVHHRIVKCLWVIG